MKGVLILHEFHPLNSNGFMLITFGSILAIVLIILCIAIIHAKDKKDAVIGFGVIGIFAAFIITIMVAACWNNPITGKTYYKVYCDETVNIQEFNEKYEVIEQEGIMYIVEERNTNQKGE